MSYTLNYLFNNYPNAQNGISLEPIINKLLTGFLTTAALINFEYF